MAEIFYRDGKSYLPLEFSPGSRSKLYPLKRSNGLELYEKAVGSNGSLAYKLIGKAPLVAGARQILFLVDPIPNPTELPLSVFGMNDTLDIFPPGTFRFFNFSNAPLQVKFGGQVSKLAARADAVVKSNVSKQGGLLPIYIADSEDKIIYENRFFAQPDFREIVFILDSSHPNGAPRVKFLTQVIPPPPANPAGQKIPQSQ